MTPEQLLVLLLLLAVTALTAVLWWTLGRAGRASRRRNLTALQGEDAAARLLERRGYRVVDSQVPGKAWMEIDGEVVQLGVRADLMVERRGKRFVAEVKTGTRAPDPTWAPTRRQLREYAAAFDDCGLLLVDAEAERIYEVAFP